MKTTLAAVSFALITTLSGLSTVNAAGFNDQSVVPDAMASHASGPQDLRRIQVAQGFNQQSHISAAALQPISRTSSAPVFAGTHLKSSG